MATTFQNLSFASYLPALTRAGVDFDAFEHIYESNRHRLYALSFRMTDNELMAEELMERAFTGAFSSGKYASAEVLDNALVAELRNLMSIGTITLSCSACSAVENVRRNIRRVDLERAVVQLPATERLVFLMHDVEDYDHSRISRCVGLTEDESRFALHLARLRVRELLARMSS
jgi:RNA polymerase sigma-70 factor, ECF subfamily